jgi:hypothetical protein
MKIIMVGSCSTCPYYDHCDLRLVMFIEGTQESIL